MIDELKKNIEAEEGMIKELSEFVYKYEHSSQEEAKMLQEVINSLRKRIRILNSTIPEMLNSVSTTKKLPQEKPKEPITEISLPSQDYKVTIKGKNKEEFLKELDISEKLIKKIKQKDSQSKKHELKSRKRSTYGRIANKIFLPLSEKWIKSGHFKGLSLDLRRSNLNILTATYLSMMILSVFIAFFAGILAFALLIFFKLTLAFPYLISYEGSYMLRMLKISWIIPAIPILTFAAFYFYPGTERKSLARMIDIELPFVVIHMSSISGSGIEPSEIFKIIGTSDDYKHTNKEIRKILNQINVYGYDLSNALRNVAMATPSAKLSELLNGISVTINSGGDISSFFEKRAESLLLEYRLEREKSNKSAETFMDMYISLVIAAPMILLMLLIMISVSGISTGFGVGQLTVAIIGIVAIVNILFLTFLHLKQPAY